MNQTLMLVISYLDFETLAWISQRGSHLVNVIKIINLIASSILKSFKKIYIHINDPELLNGSVCVHVYLPEVANNRSIGPAMFCIKAHGSILEDN